MTEPTAELQRAIYAALTASAELAAAMGGTVRAYDRVPPLPVHPYLTFADAQALDDGDTCEPDRFEIFADVHVWSRSVGMEEAKTISGVVRSVLLGLIAVNFWNVVVAQWQSSRHMRDPDGLTVHSVLTLRFILDPA